MEIIPLEARHYNSVKTIHEEGIASQVATFEMQAPNWEEWDKNHLSACRFVAIEQNEVVGWAALSPISHRSVYQGVAEVSVYVRRSEQGKGIGKSLLNKLIDASEANQIWTLQASVISANKASIDLHLATGLRIVGVREKLGHYNNTWHDVVLLERRSKKIFYSQTE